MQSQQLSNPDKMERFRRFDSYQISRTPPEKPFDDIVASPADAFHVPFAFTCTTEEHSRWFKARIGIDIEEVSRSISFCDYAPVKSHSSIVRESLA